MENLDIIILSTMLTTLFIIFIGFSIREFIKFSKEEKSVKPSDESGPRANLTKFMGKLFDEDSYNMSKIEKQKMYSAIRKTISDMESDGVYFDQEVKQHLQNAREKISDTHKPKKISDE